MRYASLQAASFACRRYHGVKILRFVAVTGPNRIARPSGLQQVRQQTTTAANRPRRPSKEDEEDEALIAKVEYRPQNTLAEIRRLFRLAVPQRRRLYAGIGLLSISASVSMSVPLALGKTLDIFTKPEFAASLPVSVPVAAGLLCLFLTAGVSCLFVY